MTDWPVQASCPCCPPSIDVPNGCAAVAESQRTGQCAMTSRAGQCHCYGTKADGGLCEDCYIETK